MPHRKVLWWTQKPTRTFQPIRYFPNLPRLYIWDEVWEPTPEQRANLETYLKTGKLPDGKD